MRKREKQRTLSFLGMTPEGSGAETDRDSSLIPIVYYRRRFYQLLPLIQLYPIRIWPHESRSPHNGPITGEEQNSSIDVL